MRRVDWNRLSATWRCRRTPIPVLETARIGVRIASPVKADAGHWPMDRTKSDPQAESLPHKSVLRSLFLLEHALHDVDLRALRILHVGGEVEQLAILEI